MRLELTINGNTGQMSTREDMIFLLRLLADQLAATSVVSQDLPIADRAGVRCGHVRVINMPRPVVALELSSTQH